MSIYEVKTLFHKNLYNLILCDDGKNKNQYTNYFYENYIYEIIINSSYITCLRINLSKDQKPYPLNSK